MEQPGVVGGLSTAEDASAEEASASASASEEAAAATPAHTAAAEKATAVVANAATPKEIQGAVAQKAVFSVSGSGRGGGVRRPGGCLGVGSARHGQCGPREGEGGKYALGVVHER